MRIHEAGGTTFCKMSGGLDMSWLDEIQKNNPLKRCQIISACAQNTVKERAVVCKMMCQRVQSNHYSTHFNLTRKILNIFHAPKIFS